MIDYSNCEIEFLAAHRVDNPTNEGNLHCSEELLNLNNEYLRAAVNQFLLGSFNQAEMFNFSSPSDNPEMNPMWEHCSRILEEPAAFLEISKDMAQLLYNSTQHHNIKDGDFFVALINNIEFKGQQAKAIGLFKSETKEDFLKLDEDDSQFLLDVESGMNLNKLDKGCLIFDIEPEKGFLINILDRSGRTSEAQFWKHEFLGLKSYADDYHHTRNFLDLTKQFVTEQIGQEFEVSKTDKIDMLNRSIDYFKENEHFDQEDFGELVFGSEEVISSFQDYGKEFEEVNDVEIEMDFAISSPAVKKQSRVFKSVLKLDKNFHVYIHGDKELIEKGIEDDGRKFYKIYYEEER